MTVPPTWGVNIMNDTNLSPSTAAKNLDRIAAQVDPSRDNRGLQAALAFLRAQLDRDFSKAATFFADDILFNGLVLQVEGCDVTAEGIVGFLQSANVRLDFDAVAQVADDRILALYRFQIADLPPQALCDHYTLRDGKITRIDNIFDVTRLPPMPS